MCNRMCVCLKSIFCCDLVVVRPCQLKQIKALCNIKDFIGLKFLFQFNPFLFCCCNKSQTPLSHDISILRINFFSLKYVKCSIFSLIYKIIFLIKLIKILNLFFKSFFMYYIVVVHKF